MRKVTQRKKHFVAAGTEPRRPFCCPRGYNADRLPFLACLLRSESGGSLVELALVLPILLLLLLGTADFSRACYLGIEVSRAAQSGALYGSRNPSDVAGMKAAAVLDAPDVPGFTTSNVIVTTGCECSDGSSASQNCSTKPTCATNQVTYVQVTTSLNYTVQFPYRTLPAVVVLHGSARMRASP
jgi:Flp pilus assembly protein TadG